MQANTASNVSLSSVSWYVEFNVIFDNGKIETKLLIKTHKIIVFSKGAHFSRKDSLIGKAVYKMCR